LDIVFFLYRVNSVGSVLLDLNDLLGHIVDHLDLYFRDLVQVEIHLATITNALIFEIDSIIEHQLVFLFNFSDENRFLIILDSLHPGNPGIHLTVRGGRIPIVVHLAQLYGLRHHTIILFIALYVLDYLLGRLAIAPIDIVNFCDVLWPC
jgi:hypothetical protein